MQNQIASSEHHRNVIGTSYDTFSDIERKLLPKFLDRQYHVVYFMGQLEMGVEDRIHLQFFFQFSQPVRWAHVKRLLEDETAHCEHAWDPQKSIDYCSKVDTRIDGPFEWGRRNDGPGQRNDALDVVQAIERGANIREIVSISPGYGVRYLSNLQKLQLYIGKAPGPRFERPEIIVYYGDPDTGKSGQIRELESEDDLYVVPYVGGESGAWFDGYRGQPAILFEEFYGGMPFGQWLRICDGYRDELVAVKGSFVRKAWRRIYFTSQKHPDDWWPIKYPNGLPDEAKRRFTKIVKMVRHQGASRLQYPPEATIVVGAPPVGQAPNDWFDLRQNQ